MKPTSSSANPDPGDSNTARLGGVSQAVGLPRWQSKVPAVVGAVLAVAVLVGGFLWYRYGSSWGSDQGGNRALAALRAEPILKGAQGWTRTSYDEEAEAGFGGPARIRVSWYSPDTQEKTRAKVLAQYASVYGRVAADPVTGSLNWRGTGDISASVDVRFSGVDSRIGTEVKVDLRGR